MTTDLPTTKTARGPTQAKTDRVSTIECPSANHCAAQFNQSAYYFLSNIKVPSLTISGSAARARVSSSHGKNTLRYTRRSVTSMLPSAICPSTLATKLKVIAGPRLLLDGEQITVFSLEGCQPGSQASKRFPLAQVMRD